MMRSFFSCVLFFVLLSAAGLAQKSGSTWVPMPPPPASDNAAKEAVIVESLVTRVSYERDGAGTRESTEAIRVQSEAGVQALAAGIAVLPLRLRRKSVS